MTKRARITLDPEPEQAAETALDMETTTSFNTDPEWVDEFDDEPSHPCDPLMAAGSIFTARNVIKVALVGLAVASAVVLWKRSRR